MASSVATPLEKQFTTIAGLDSMTSTSSLGNAQITLQFDLSRNIDSAALDVQSAISAAANQLPPNLPSPPTFRKVNPADQAIFVLAVTSPTLPLYEVDKYAENLIAEQISDDSRRGPGQCHGRRRNTRCVSDWIPRLLPVARSASMRLTQAIQNANVNMPMGTLSAPTRPITSNPTGNSQTAKRLPPVDRRLPQRCSGAAGSTGYRQRRCPG